MTRNTRIQVVAVGVMIACLASSTVLATRLTGLAGRHRLTFTERAEDGQRWEVGLGIAMGAFRGIFVNWLWIRANSMKEAGKFFDAIQLADAITRLQPRFPRVWVFHAWNLAYNISVQTSTPLERWVWVNRGVALMRDRGIPANPNDLLLHKELAWIFLHKIGGFTDDANIFYKRELAREWTIILGAPPPPSPTNYDRDAAVERFASWLEAIDRAPDTLEEVVAAEPTVPSLVSRLRAEAGSELDPLMLQRYEVYRHVRRSGRASVIQAAAGERTRAFGAIYEDPALAKAWEALIPHVRKRVLIDRYHMEPERMIRYTRKYGPLDWRHPAAHGLYWAARGVEASIPFYKESMRSEFDYTNTDRLVLHAVQDLFRTGEVYFDFLSAATGQRADWLGMPSVHFVRSYGDQRSEVARRAGIFESRGERAYTVYAAGHENFLREAVTLFYRRGQRDEAERWYQVLRTGEGWNLNDPDRPRRFAKNLDEFVQDELEQEYTRPAILVEQVTGALIGAFANGLLAGDTGLFREQHEFAKKVHRFFFEYQYRKTVTAREDPRMAYLDPDFDLVAGMTFVQFLRSMSLDDAVVTYGRAPDELKNFALDALRDHFGAQIAEEQKSGGKAFELVFVEPPDHKAFMAALQVRLQKRQRDRADVEQK